MKRLIAATVTLSLLSAPAFACGMKRVPTKAIALNDLMKQVDEAEEKVHADTKAIELEKVEIAEVEAKDEAKDAQAEADAEPKKQPAPQS